MDTHVLLTVVALVIAMIILSLGRLLYVRSMRLRRRTQMSAIFTNLTHELLTPLTVISASVDLLRDQEPRFGRNYDLMQLNIQRMVRLLQQLLETSKAETGRLELLVARGDVMAYIRETTRCIEPLVAKKSARLTIDCQPETMMGWIDTDKLDKIIYDLLSNVAKYTAENGEVTVRASTNRTYDHVRIEVSGTGDGIPRERLRTLFRRFQDGDHRQHDTIGTGIGLALTHDLVRLHGGSIDCKSVQGQGTTFTVTIPITKDAFTPEQIDDQRQADFDVPENAITEIWASIPGVNEDMLTTEPTDEDSYKVLIVEDNVELLMLMKQLLDPYYRIHVARDGLKALEVIREKELDLIVSDVVMPRMGGFELTCDLKADPNFYHLPIILLTTTNKEEDLQKAMRIGADELLVKPFRLGDLKLRIDNIIENRKRIQHEYSQQTVEEMRQRMAKTAKPSADELFLQHALEQVHKHLADDSYDREALAADMGASSSTLYNKLRSITGMNVSTFIRDIRMKEARRMAEENPHMRVSDLAYRVGFRDPRYFSTCFKKQYGIQPKEFLDSLVQGER